MKAGYHGHYITTFTGWMLLSGFSSEWLQQFTSVCTAWLQRTSLNCVRLSLRQQVVVVGFGPPQPAIWSYHAADCQLRQPCFQCRWSSLLEHSTRLSKVTGHFFWLF